MSRISSPIPETFYNYVQDAAPNSPSEGETWYDTAADESKVYDGSAWVVQNIESHGALSGVNVDDHHTRYSDAEAQAATHDKYSPSYYDESADKLTAPVDAPSVDTDTATVNDKLTASGLDLQDTVLDTTVPIDGGGLVNIQFGSLSDMPVVATAVPVNDPNNDHGYRVDSVYYDASGDAVRIKIKETIGLSGGNARIIAWSLGT
jgi:hypothetical protein